MELSFKDLNGTELKVGDTVLKAIGSRLVERTIKSIRITSWQPDDFHAKIQLSGVKKKKRYDGLEYERRFNSSSLTPADLRNVIKKPVVGSVIAGPA